MPSTDIVSSPSTLVGALQSGDCKTAGQYLRFLFNEVDKATQQWAAGCVVKGDSSTMDSPFGPSLPTPDDDTANNNASSNKSSGDGCADVLDPEGLLLLLDVFTDRAADAEWMEMRRTTAAYLACVVDRGFGEVLADALLYNEIRLSSESEAQCCRVRFPEGDCSWDEATQEGRVRAMVRDLLDAHGMDRFGLAANVFQSLMRVPALLETVLLWCLRGPPDLHNRAGLEHEGDEQQQRQYRELGAVMEAPRNYFSRYVDILTSPALLACLQSWRSVRMLLLHHSVYSVKVLSHCFGDISAMLVSCLSMHGPSFVARQSALALLEEMITTLPDSECRERYVSSPVILLAVMQVANEQVDYTMILAARVISVMLQRASQTAAAAVHPAAVAAAASLHVRHILVENKRELHRFLAHCSSLPGAEILFNICVAETAHQQLDALPTLKESELSLSGLSLS